MQCPVDGATLVMTDRSGIEIDYCPTCRGVWLDRGELDKIIERAAPALTPPAPTGRGADPRDRDRDSGGYGDDRDRRDGDQRRKKKSGFLGDMFDF